MKPSSNTDLIFIKAISIGIDYDYPSSDLWSIEDSLNELKELAKTADIEIINRFTQKREKPDRTSYIGKGKTEEVKTYITENSIDIILVDEELSPSQSKFLEKFFEKKIIDRTSLILDIFATRAQSYEAKLQIELAQLNYSLPRLTRLWTHLSRTGGGIGARGPGEKQLEVDKRQIAQRISLIKSKLVKIQQDRTIRRKHRKTVPVLSGAIVGYTNAGKSTLMNRLTHSSVLVEDKLFATLDPTSRKYSENKSHNIVLTDTVGFIQKLPTLLIKAFYSTLEEVTFADFILHVVDASHPNLEKVIQASSSIIKQLNADQKPLIYVFNKIDKISKINSFKKSIEAYQPQLLVSAIQDPTLETLHNSITELLDTFQKTITFFVPYTRMDIYNQIHENGHVLSVEYKDKIEVLVTINDIIGNKIMASLHQKED
jgi:GTP-binding protein HflX